MPIDVNLVESGTSGTWNQILYYYASVCDKRISEDKGHTMDMIHNSVHSLSCGSDVQPSPAISANWSSNLIWSSLYITTSSDSVSLSLE